MENQVFVYNGNPITFQIGNTTMVNATQMAKPFNKVTKDWLRTKSSQEFISSLSTVRQISLTELVVVNQGNFSSTLQGTWMHEDVAIEFARWLSPQFAIWCNDRIKELMKYGITATPQTIDNILADPGNAIKILQALQEERKRVRKLEDVNKCYHSENKRLLKLQSRTDELMTKQAPLVEYARNVLATTDTFTSTQLAKEQGMSAQALHKFLHTVGVMFKQGSQWFLYSKYMDRGYVKTKEYVYTKKDGRTGVMLATVWTEAGRMFIHELIRFKKSIK